jgi:Tol biopolymer transport system component
MRVAVAIVGSWGVLLLVVSGYLTLRRPAEPSIIGYHSYRQTCYIPRTPSNESICIRNELNVGTTSPDGEKSAYVMTNRFNEDAYFYPYSLVIESRQAVTESFFLAPLRDIRWSPTSQQLAFVNYSPVNTTRTLTVANADGSVYYQTQFGSVHSPPDWSPDGEWIAYTLRVGAIQDNVYIMRRDGSENRKLTDNAAQDYNPRWSPDAQWIAFVSTRDNGDAEIYRVRSDGSDVQRLTIRKSADVFQEWSPDGKQIAYLSTQGNQQYVYLINSDGSDDRRLLPVQSSVTRLSWVVTEDFNPLPLLLISGVLLGGIAYRRVRKFPRQISQIPTRRWQGH